MLILDHIAIAATDLAAGTAWVSERLGVPLQPGGQHAHYATHNTLLGLGDLYLEVIAPDPKASVPRPRWFGLDHVTGDPHPANWICRTDSFDLAPPEAGLPVPLQRGDLSWQITVPDDGSLPFGGAYPTLIQWGADTPHPADLLPDSGCRLIRWEVRHPDAERLAAMTAIRDPRVSFVPGPSGFRAVIDTPQGERVL